MTNPFLTSVPKKGRCRRCRQEPQLPIFHQQQQKQEQQPHINPFLKNKFSNGFSSEGVNSFSEQKFVQPHVEPPLSFDEAFPSLSKSNDPCPPTKLNFKSAIQGISPSGNPVINPGNQGINPGNPVINPGNHIQNQFLRPRFMQPVNSYNRYHRMRNPGNEFNDEDDGGNDNDAYDSAYTKYYED